MNFAILDGKEIGLAGILRRAIPLSLFSIGDQGNHQVTEITYDDLVGSGQNSGEGEVAVLLPDTSILRRTVRVPRAAESRTHDAIAMQMRQALPNRGAGLVWKERLQHREDRLLVFEVFIAKKTLLDEIRQIASDRDLKLARIEVSGSTEVVLWDNAKPMGKSERRWVTASMGLVMALSMACVIHIERRIFRIEEQSTDLGLWTAEIGQQLEEYKAKSNLADTQDPARTLEVFRQGARPALILSDIGIVFEGTAWVSELEFGPGRIRLAGFSEDDIPSLVERFQTLPWAKGARLTGPVVRDSYLGQNRFELQIETVLP